MPNTPANASADPRRIVPTVEFVPRGVAPVVRTLSQTCRTTEALSLDPWKSSPFTGVPRRCPAQTRR